MSGIILYPLPYSYMKHWIGEVTHEDTEFLTFLAVTIAYIHIDNFILCTIYLSSTNALIVLTNYSCVCSSTVRVGDGTFPEYECPIT